jgi:hypothetical protein
MPLALFVLIGLVVFMLFDFPARQSLARRRPACACDAATT